MVWHEPLLGLYGLMDDAGTRGERRERKRKSRRKMRVTGKSVRLLLDLARRRAERVKSE